MSKRSSTTISGGRISNMIIKQRGRNILSVLSSSLFFLFIICCLVEVTEGETVEYYLSTTGSDSTGTGSLSKPFYSLTKVTSELSTRSNLDVNIYFMTGQYSTLSTNTLSLKNQNLVSITTYQPPSEEEVKNAKLQGDGNMSGGGGGRSTAASSLFYFENVQTIQISSIDIDSFTSSYVICISSNNNGGGNGSKLNTSKLLLSQLSFTNNKHTIIYPSGVVSLISLQSINFKANGEYLIYNKYFNEKPNFSPTFISQVQINDCDIQSGNFGFYFHYMNQINITNSKITSLKNTAIYIDVSPHHKQYDNYLNIENTEISSCVLDPSTSTFASALYYIYTATTSSGTSLDSLKTRLMITNSTFQNNYARSAGSIYLQYISANLQSVSFINSSSLYNGGAITAYSSYLNISQSTFQSNTAKKGNGGAIDLSLSSMLICSNCSFSSNSALLGSSINCGNNNGGDDNECSLIDCNFKNNRNEDGGDDVTCSNTSSHSSSSSSYPWYIWVIISIVIATVILLVIVILVVVGLLYRSGKLSRGYSNTTQTSVNNSVVDDDDDGNNSFAMDGID